MGRGAADPVRVGRRTTSVAHAPAPGCRSEPSRLERRHASRLGLDHARDRKRRSPAVLGQSIEINGTAVSLVGVMPAGFKLPLDFGADGRTEVYLPLATDAAQHGAVPGPALNPNGGSHAFFAVARLAPGATAALANSQLRDRVAALVRESMIPPSMNFRAFAIPIADQVSGEVRGPLLILLGAVGVVLLIACANVAGLLLVRGDRRRRELAVRTALGAGRGRLARLLFAETGLLAALGAVLGIVVAWAGIEGIKRFAPASLPRVAEAQIDPVLLASALAIATLTALLTGILPSLQAPRSALSRVISHR